MDMPPEPPQQTNFLPTRPLPATMEAQEWNVVCFLIELASRNLITKLVSQLQPQQPPMPPPRPPTRQPMPASNTEED